MQKNYLVQVTALARRHRCAHGQHIAAQQQPATELNLMNMCYFNPFSCYLRVLCVLCGKKRICSDPKNTKPASRCFRGGCYKCLMRILLNLQATRTRTPAHDCTGTTRIRENLLHVSNSLPTITIASQTHTDFDSLASFAPFAVKPDHPASGIAGCAASLRAASCSGVARRRYSGMELVARRSL